MRESAGRHAPSWRIHSECECLWTRGDESFHPAKHSYRPRWERRQFQTLQTRAPGPALCELSNRNPISLQVSPCSAPFGRNVSPPFTAIGHYVECTRTISTEQGA